MVEKQQPVSKDEAIEMGSPLYVTVGPAYIHEYGLPPETGELVGSNVQVLTVEEDRLILGTTINRRNFMLARRFERAVAKTIKQENRFVRITAKNYKSEV